MRKNILDSGQNNRIEISDDVVFVGKHNIQISGDNNVLRIGSGTLVRGMIKIKGNNSLMDIGNDCKLKGKFFCLADNTRLIIGSKTTSMWVLIALHEEGSITIGADCMFSANIIMDVSDMHSILDIESNKRINPPGDIEIGDHVWVGEGVYIMKGVKVGPHTIIGAKAVVNSSIPANSIAVGVPAKVVRKNVTWDRQRLPFK